MPEHETKLQTLAEAVRTMRDLQKRFFAGERNLVGEAKVAERRVDRLVEDVLGAAGGQTRMPGL